MSNHANKWINLIGEMNDKLSFQYWASTLDEIYLDAMKMVHPGKDINQGMKEAYAYLLADPERLQRTEPADFKRLVNGWLSNKPFPKKTQPVGFRKLIDLKNI